MDEPICRHLRTKKMYIPMDPPEDETERADEPHCWCNLTMTEVGADDRVVNRRACVPGRPCHNG